MAVTNEELKALGSQLADVRFKARLLQDIRDRISREEVMRAMEKSVPEAAVVMKKIQKRQDVTLGRMEARLAKLLPPDPVEEEVI